VLPAIIGSLGLCGLIEMIFQMREAPTGETEMTLFWTAIDTHHIWAWLVFGGIAAGGLLLARQQTSILKEAWDQANTIDTPAGEPS